MDFIAFDFETANEKRSSACALGIAVVENNRITEKKEFLIHPEPFFFNPYNTMVHGIQESDVKDAPTMADLWPDIRHYFHRNIVAAHNASFDISVLRHSLEQYGIEVPCMDILCTYRLAQNYYPNAGSYRLNAICKRMNIDLIHHNSLSDACGAAEILCQMMSERDATSLYDLERNLSFSHGYISEFDPFAPEWRSRYSPCRLIKDRCNKAPSSQKVDINAISTEYCDPDFFEKNFVFTGTLVSMTRNKAYEIVKKGGGNPQNALTRKTNVLVVGIQDISKLNGNSMSAKMRKALELNEKGFDIQIIGEDDFLALIDDELYQKCF